MRLILASTSPRRIELLQLAKLTFDTLSVSIEEAVKVAEPPTDYICRMARQKMQAAIASLSIKTPAILLTADTIGVIDGQILTKPYDKADAFRMWSLLSARTHEVWTAVEVCTVVNEQVVFNRQILQKTKVSFISLDEQKMTEYWDSGEPYDKAGGYAIQGLGAAWVESICGSYTNVVGLPLAQTLALIGQARQAAFE